MRKRSESAPGEPAKPEPPPLFVSNNTGNGIDLSPSMASIVETTFNVDILTEYNRLEAALTIGEHRADYHTVLKALDEAESNARTAHKVYLAGKIERERWELENESVRAAMWNEANRALQYEKDNGKRSKQITDADVRSQCAAQFSDQWTAFEVKAAKVKGVEKQMEKLAELWVSRCRTLNTILSTLRK